jgi:hypothetical protein
VYNELENACKEVIVAYMAERLSSPPILISVSIVRIELTYIPEEGSSRFLRNAVNDVPYYTWSHFRRQHLTVTVMRTRDPVQ